MSYQKFAKDVVLIGVTQLLTGLSVFLLLPVITKTLSVYEYGIWAQIWVTVSLLSPLALLGLSQATIRYLAAESDITKIRNIFYSGILFVTIWGSFISLVVIFLSDPIARIFFQDGSTVHLIRLAAFLILLTALYQLSSLYFRIFQMNVMFALITILKTFGHLLLVLLFLWAGLGLQGVIGATLAIHLIMTAFSLVQVVSRIGLALPNFSELKEVLIYGIPLTPNPMLDWLRSSSDRYIIGIFLGMGAVGIYSVAYSLGSIILVLVGPIQFILFPSLSKIYDEKRYDEVKNYLRFSIKYFLMIAIPSAFGISALAVPLLTTITTSDYLEGAMLIPFIAFGGVLFGVYQISINVTQLVKKTKFNLYLYLIVAVSSILLNVLLVPILGILGAAISSLVSMIVLVFLSMALSSRYIRFNIDKPFVLKSILSSLIMVGIITLLSPETLLGIIVAILSGMIAYFTLLVTLKSFTQQEVALFKTIMSSYIPKIKI